jgi:hypothetical protein
MAAPVTLPDTFLYGTKSGLPRIKSYQIPYSATALTYNVNNQTIIRLDIPPIQNGYLDTTSSFLSFKATVATADLALDNSAYAFINSIQVYSFNQSLLLESVTDHAVLASLLWDLTSDINTQMQTYSTLAGFSETARRQGATITAGSSRTFAIPLLSILGLFADKHLPMSGYTLIIALNNIQTVGVSAGNPTATLSDVFYYAHIHEVPMEVQQMILSANGGVITVPCHSYRSYSSTVAADTFTNSMAVGARFSSIKSIYFTIRPTTNLEAQTSWTNTNRCKNFLQSYQFRLGSEFVPIRPVVGATLCYANLLRAVHGFGISQPTLLSFTDYNRDAQAAGGASGTQASFLCGEDLERSAVRKTSGSNGLLAGTSSLGLTAFFLDTNYTIGTNPVAHIINVFCNFDCVLSYPGGNQVTVQF